MNTKVAIFAFCIFAIILPVLSAPKKVEGKRQNLIYVNSSSIEDQKHELKNKLCSLIESSELADNFIGGLLTVDKLKRFHTSIASLNNPSNKDLGESFHDKLTGFIKSKIDSKKLSQRDSSVFWGAIGNISRAFATSIPFLNATMSFVSSFSPFDIEFISKHFLKKEMVVRQNTLFDEKQIEDIRSFSEKYFSFYDTLITANNDIVKRQEFDSTSLIYLVNEVESSKSLFSSEFNVDSSSCFKDPSRCSDDILASFNDDKSINYLSAQVAAYWRTYLSVAVRTQSIYSNLKSNYSVYSVNVGKAIDFAKEKSLFDAKKLEIYKSQILSYTTPGNDLYIWQNFDEQAKKLL